MDFSEKYVKMCEEAKEIQQMKEEKGWEDGDWCYDYEEGDFYCTKKKYVWLIFCGRKADASYYNFMNWYEPSKDATWLPRQDQLQEMLIGSFRKISGRIEQTSIYELTWRFYHFIGDMGMYRGIYKRDPQYLFNTAEQLWFAFVMWEKYDKVWDDQREEWVKKVQND